MNTSVEPAVLPKLIKCVAYKLHMVVLKLLIFASPVAVTIVYIRLDIILQGADANVTCVVQF